MLSLHFTCLDARLRPTSKVLSAACQITHVYVPVRELNVQVSAVAHMHNFLTDAIETMSSFPDMPVVCPQSLRKKRDASDLCSPTAR